jgi:hypothetical protein
LIKITDQEKDAIVVLPTGNPAAYKSGSDSLFSNEYEVIDGLNYENKKSLIKKGESIETWLAFIVDKEDHSPLIMWNRYENKAFQNKGAAISNADTIEAGAALEKNLSLNPNLNLKPKARLLQIDYTDSCFMVNLTERNF